jgi:hypothetical protein
VVAEPLVFFRDTTSTLSLLINPELWLFFKLEEKAPGIWWDPPKGIEAIRQQAIESGKVEIVEIRVEYLSKYLQARQMALLIEHIRRLQLYNPTQEMISRFEEGTVTLGSPAQGVKARGKARVKAIVNSSLDSLAGRQLKWVYPTSADDNEFLKRATLACT